MKSYSLQTYNAFKLKYREENEKINKERKYHHKWNITSFLTFVYLQVKVVPFHVDEQIT